MQRLMPVHALFLKGVGKNVRISFFSIKKTLKLCINVEIFLQTLPKLGFWSLKPLRILNNNNNNRHYKARYPLIKHRNTPEILYTKCSTNPVCRIQHREIAATSV